MVKKILMKISILDYKAGNLASVYYFFYNLGLDVKVISELNEIKNAERLVIPGVGSAKKAIEYLNKNHIIEALQSFLITEKPILGICLGLQIFCKNLMEKGRSKGLGFIDADVVQISNKKEQLYNHVGWNNLSYDNDISKKFKIKKNSYFYFCHSYYVSFKNPLNTESEYACTNYKNKKIPAIILKENFLGTQFHPEKSQVNGSKLLENYFKL